MHTITGLQPPARLKARKVKKAETRLAEAGADTVKTVPVGILPAVAPASALIIAVAAFVKKTAYDAV